MKPNLEAENQLAAIREQFGFSAKKGNGMTGSRDERQPLSTWLNWAVLPLLPYSEYLQTKHWQMQRREALERTHHRTYENIGNERNEDLIVLCDRCQV